LCMSHCKLIFLMKIIADDETEEKDNLNFFS